MSKITRNFCLVAILFAHALSCSAQTNTTAEKEPSIRDLHESARKLVGQGEYSKAVEKLLLVVSKQPKNARLRMELADSQFMAGEMVASIKSYDAVVELEPSAEPHLWQRGIALYYARKFESGKQQFETHQTVNSADVENSVWHLLCAARSSSVESARKKMINIVGDSRVPMSEVFQMFAGTLKPEDVLASIEKRKTKDAITNRRQAYYAHLYIGLYHEMTGAPTKSLDSIKLAIDVNPFGPESFMGQVARIHAEVRKSESDSKEKQNKK